MLQTQFIDDLTREIAKALPAGVGELQRDVEKNVQAVVQRAFDRMGLVTREEFEVQSAVLVRTREKLTALEQRVTELETELLRGG